MQAAGKQDDAERLYRRATALAPEIAEILFAYAAFRRECGDAAQAATLLERVVAMVPDAVNGWLELTRARHGLAQWDACVAPAERTLALDASCLEAELMRAVALFAQHKHDEAAQSIERVAEKLPDDPGVQLFHARCLMAQKHYEEARAPAQRAARLAIDGEDGKHYLVIGRTGHLPKPKRFGLGMQPCKPKCG